MISIAHGLFFWYNTERRIHTTDNMPILTQPQHLYLRPFNPQTHFGGHNYLKYIAGQMPIGLNRSPLVLPFG